MSPNFIDMFHLFISPVLLWLPKPLHVFINPLFKNLELSTPFKFTGFSKKAKVVKSCGVINMMGYPMWIDTQILPLYLLYVYHHHFLLTVKLPLWYLYGSYHSQLLHLPNKGNLFHERQLVPIPQPNCKCPLCHLYNNRNKVEFTGETFHTESIILTFIES